MTLSVPPARTYLYVPADRPARFLKAAASGADAVVLDLEDGVAPGAKDAARRAVRDFEPTSTVQWWVRVDPERLMDDLETAAEMGAVGVFLPGVEPDLLAETDELLVELERHSSRESLSVIGLVETPLALRRLDSICVGPRVVRLGIGEADLAAALGMFPGEDRQELWAARSDVVVASAAAGLMAPVGPVETRLGDEQVLADSTARLVRQGFGARTAIHPDQVAAVHRALEPSPEEINRAREILDIFERARDRGNGVAVTPGGRLIDLAVVRSARAILARL